MFQKYFIAIVPPEPLLSHIQDVKRFVFENYQTKGALRSPGHITLHMPFSWEESKEDKLLTAIEAFKYTDNFTISLANFSCFEPRVVFINVEESEQLLDLQKKLVQHVKVNLQLFNQSDDLRGFHPHITIAFRDLKKPVFYKLWSDYQHKLFEAKFTCRSFSLLKQAGDRWDVYKTFEFRT
ncbi:MAG: 2'-5' RNA ligase family protein [Bacteroidetes bacterium]|nr:2'-5' RNA ligase family protein [Bacteroidota bacterium]